MLKKFFSITIISILAFAETFAQGVSVEARIDSMTIFIGEQTGVTLTVVSPSEKVVQMPNIKAGQMVAPGVEVVDVLEDDTTKIYDATRQIRRSLEMFQVRNTRLIRWRSRS